MTAVARAGGSRAAARIRLAAVGAFAELGYHGTSTRAIAERLEMSPAAMYPHYRSKEDLLFAIIEEGHEQALAAVESADRGETATERLRAAVGGFARWHAENHLLARVAQYELSALSPERYKKVSRLRNRTSAAILRIIEDGREQGEFGTDDTRGAALAILSLCIDICRWFPSRTHRKAEALAELYAGLSLRMVGARTPES